MNALFDIIARRIQLTGPISIADYMSECLLHPEHGYYSKRDPFGRAGDFITAPEISQMFGELLGIALADTWANHKKPDNFTLCELGPGRGTLMADLLRATRNVPGFHAAAQVHLIDASPKLRAVQKSTLATTDVTWVNQIEDLPDAPLFLIANEFFDALPIRQFSRHESGWCEHRVGLKDAALFLARSAPTPVAELEHRLDDTIPGDIVETCAPATVAAAQIATAIAVYGGVAVIIDYGAWGSNGDTFQAVQYHAPTAPFVDPGNADLTAHVDFKALADSAANVAHTSLTPQGRYLERLGISERAAALADGLSGDPLTAHIAAHRRLTHPHEMGTLFKVLGLYPRNTTPPLGFDP